MGSQQTFNSLQQMNSDAIYLILEGRSEEALEYLAQCAEATRCYLSSTKDVSASSFASSPQKQAPLTLFAVSLDEVIYPFDCSERVSPDNCFRLHRYVYLIDGVTSSPSHSTFQKLLATILYNMAVVSHESVQGGLYPKILEKARTFYELALAMVHIGKEESPGTFETMPLKLALYNNLGHIYAFFFNRDGAVFCRDRLDNILTHAHASGLGSDAFSFFQVPPFMARNHMSKAPAA